MIIDYLHRNIAAHQCTTNDYMWEPCYPTCGPGQKTGTKKQYANCAGNQQLTQYCNEGSCPGT